ncbi:MAG: hypothetical protein ACE5DO_15505, partial [Desulfobacterales bacterium]
MAKNKFLTALPAIDSILESDKGKMLGKQIRHDTLVELAREAVATVRAEILSDCGRIESAAAVVEKTMARFAKAAHNLLTPSMRKVINCTGIILHTGLGRAVIS